MPTILRIVFLAVFAAAGVGTAIAVALQPVAEVADAGEAAAGSDKTSTSSVANSVAVLPATVTVPETPVLAVEELPAPLSAPYRPAIANQAEAVAETLQKIEQAAAARQGAVEETLSRLRDMIEAPRHQEEPLPPPPDSGNTPLLAPPQLSPPVEPLPAPPDAKVHRDEGDDRLTVNVQNSDIREVLELLSQQGGLNILASKSVSGNVTASLNGVSIDTALAAILKSTGYVARHEDGVIYVGTPEDLATMEQAQDRIVTRVYRPNYIRAADLQPLFVPLLTPQIGQASVSAPAEVDIPADQVKTGGDSFAESDVIIVRDFERVVRQIDQIFAEVDVRPKQVSIEAMIISVKLSDEFKFGVNFELLRNKANVRLVSGAPPDNLANINLANGQLNVGFLDESLGVFLDALETIGDTNVIASPRLTCLNKQKAEIQIGEELGYVSTTVTETAATQTVNFLDVGTLLRIRPFIGNDGQIRMEIHPELSTGTVETKEGMSLPRKSVTQVTSNVMCRDGCTVVIGGLIREDLQTSSSQLPLLGSLPYVGPVFRNKKETIGRVEVIVLITPRVMSDPMMTEEGLKFGNQFTERQSVYFDKMSPIGKRNYGLHWLRKSRAAFAAQDYDTALRQVNMSIQFDPLNRDAIVLRNEIITAGGFENESIHDYLKQGLPPLNRRHRDYSKDGYPWKQPEGFGEPIQESIDDPGVPGPVRTIAAQPSAPIVSPAEVNPAQVNR